jgi:tetratricopeptide (TPR) repeat protein/CHAT domain-containing protein
MFVLVRVRWLAGVLAALTAAPGFAQEVPKATPDGKRALAELLRACADAGALKEVVAQPGKEPAWQPGDSTKLAAVFAARKEKLTPVVRDAIFAAIFAARRVPDPVFLALLEAFGRQTKDERAQGWAALLTGFSEQQRLRLEEAVAAYETAAKHLAAAKEDAWLALTFNNLAAALQARGEYARAQGYYERALAMRQRLYPAARYPGGHPDLAASLNNLGGVLRARGEYARAQGYYEQALAMCQRLYPAARYPGGHPDLAASLNNLGGVLQDRGEYAQAQGYYEQALAMCQRLYPAARYPGGHPDLALSLTNLGFVLRDRGEYAQAQGYFEQALAMCQRLYPAVRYPGGHPDLGRSLNNLGFVLRDRGEYAQAQGYFEQALAMYQRLYPAVRYPGGHPDLAASLTNLGGVLQDRGEYAQAQGYFEQALAMYQRLYPEARYPGGHPDLARSLNNLGGVLQDRGEYAQAQGYYQQALAMCQRLYPGARYPGGHPDLARSLNNLGGVLRTRGKYAQAQGYCQQALAMYQRLYPGARYPGGHPDLARSLNNLGGVLRDRVEYAQAQGYFEQALAMCQRLYPGARYPGGHPNLAQSLNNLGGVLQDRGEYAQAQGYYEQALRASRTATREIPVHDPIRAAQYLAPTPNTAVLAANRARILRQQLPSQASAGQLRSCADSYSLVAALHERLRSEVLLDPESKIQHGARPSAVLAERIGVLERLARVSGDSAPLREAFAAVEQTRARVFLDSLGEAHAARLAGLPANLREEEDRLRESLRACDARLLTARTRPGTEPAALQQLWHEQQAAEQALHQFALRVAQSHPDYAALRFPSPCTLEQARACLAPHEVAVLFAVGPKESFALVVQPRPPANSKDLGIALVPLPGSDVLAPAVRTLLDDEVLKSDSRCRELGARLYDLLWKPLAPYLGNHDLVVGADGVLWELPFELLVTGRTERHDGTYLVQTRQIRYTPSLTVLDLIGKWESRRQAPAEPLWALADPVFSKKDRRANGDLAVAARELVERYALRGGGDADWTRLEATRMEVSAIAKLYGASRDDIVTDTAACEQVLKTASSQGILARKRYVHLATHGVLGLGRKRPPSLVLSLVGNDLKEQLGGLNDGFLTLPEVTHLKLNADLVVLSACQTARGEMQPGEGVVGLSRAFLYAGSRGVVCSLWNVDDERTATLMQGLYARLKEGRPAALALTEARRQMIAREEAPFYWAPFILIGK